LWSAELAAALAPFAEDTASLGRLGRHDDFDKDYSNLAYRSANPRFKTEVCRNFKEKGTCLYGDLCQFAHGKHELRSDVVRHNKYKTKLCQKYWIAGYCAYGPRCNFIHQVTLLSQLDARCLVDTSLIAGDRQGRGDEDPGQWLDGRPRLRGLRRPQGLRLWPRGLEQAVPAAGRPMQRRGRLLCRLGGQFRLRAEGQYYLEAIF
jgi:hypothetical protein